jgi:hypothetical protein
VIGLALAFKVIDEGAVRVAGNGFQAVLPFPEHRSLSAEISKSSRRFKAEDRILKYGGDISVSGDQFSRAMLYHSETVTLLLPEAFRKQTSC